MKPDSRRACAGTAAVTLLAIAAFFYTAAGLPATAVESVAAAHSEATGGRE